jgi:hypothetical protein
LFDDEAINASILPSDENDEQQSMEIICQHSLLMESRE